MGLAALVPGNIDQVSLRESALERLQYGLFSRSKIAVLEVKEALVEDVSARRPISLMVLTKLLDSRGIAADSAAIRDICAYLRDAMVQLPLEEADLFINYAQAAVICVKRS
ncbi:MAG: hypothetical protein RL417_1282 [Pseudomonadota bacterium]|jgi:hypothetical protein